MDIREATTGDVSGIQRVARASLAASYGHALEESVREQAVETWYADDRLADELTDEDAVVVVAVEGGDVVGFAQAYLVDRDDAVGRIDWIHVHPDHRDAGLGDQLLARVETDLLDAGATRLEGRVLEVNDEGMAFYRHHDYEAAGERTLAIGDAEFAERSFTKVPAGVDTSAELVEEREGPEGQSLFVAYDESDRGSLAPLYAAYADTTRADRYGWFCGNCESFAVNMDTMGRVECTDCGNRRKPSRWDATYGG